MFNEGEAAIFQRLGMAPVFFGETLVGRNLPSLTYMLSFESLAARDKLWGAFGAAPTVGEEISTSNRSNACAVISIETNTRMGASTVSGTSSTRFER